MCALYFAPASAKTTVNLPQDEKHKLKEKWTPYNDSLDVWSPYEDLKATVLSPVRSTNAGIPSQYVAAPVWGITPSAAKSDWTDILSSGEDFIIFYSGDECYPYIARVHHKDVNKDLAKDLWPYHELAGEVSGNAPGDPWSKILYFDTVWHANIPDEHIAALKDPKGPKDLVIRRFRRIPSRRLPGSPAKAVEHWTGEIASAAVGTPAKNRPSYQTYLNLLYEDDDDKLLSEALIPTDVKPQNLPEKTRQKILSCIYERY